MEDFDIAPFALPRTPANELWFEQPRDVRQIVVRFAGPVPSRLGVSYLQRTWPEQRIEALAGMDRVNPCRFGWQPIDDWFNTTWKQAAVELKRPDPRTAVIRFHGLRREFPKLEAKSEYDVTFRRTLGVRVDAPAAARIRKIELHTISKLARSRLRVAFDAGRRTPSKGVALLGYNTAIGKFTGIAGAKATGRSVLLGAAKRRVFEVDVRHMSPGHAYCHDEGHVTFELDRETFTISLASLEEQGPIWFAEQGVFITRADDATTFAEYKARHRGAKTVRRTVSEAPEQSRAGAFQGQPRPHAVAYSFGCKHARQRFWLEPSGDLVLTKGNVTHIPGPDTPRFRNERDGRLFFGLGAWIPAGRFTDPPPVLAYNLHLKRDELTVEQKSFAVPLERSILDGEARGDETIVALMRFRFRNDGTAPALAELPIEYSSASRRSFNRLSTGPGPDSGQDDHLAPLDKREALTARRGRITGRYRGKPVLRCAYESTMTPRHRGHSVVLQRELAPGQTCEVVLRVPFIALDKARELEALGALDFARCYRQAQRYWRREHDAGAQVHTPDPHLNALHAMHQAHVKISDVAMPDDPAVINTSVGTSTYGNFTNESCMIVEELEQRGLHDEARRRIELWLKYQGTKGLNGCFSDHDDVFYGAGGYEQGQNYCQHHGWVLWIIAEHYFYTGDADWLRGAADKLIAGLDWVFRQRRQTLDALPHSRGWEKGFLPAGGLEDVGDYCYWLSTNALTWRGCDAAASALEAIRHPEAPRARREANAYRRDLLRGFETERQHTPLVRLRDGRWVGNYPSRLYSRGREYGWIRETLEGSIYLLISGLFGAESRPARWIIEDFHDNRYMSPPYGYVMVDPEKEWFDRGGLSIQPNLLAGLLPHLDRDEIEIYLWMFANCFSACYREEITGMVEHPMPVLGFSNTAHFKTSDEANAVKWLQYMFAYAPRDVLHVGKALPREWLGGGEPVRAARLKTRFGAVSVEYRGDPTGAKLQAEVRLDLHREPARTLVRFRHPRALPIRSVKVNGKAHRQFDAKTGDVDVTGRAGRIAIEAAY